MKRLSFILLLLLLSGCKTKEIKVYSDSQIEEFDQMLSLAEDGDSKTYDLRNEQDCRSGRIPGFFCVRIVNSKGLEKSLDQICEDLQLILGKDKGRLIVFMDYDGSDANFLSEKLFKAGYYNIHYFQSGYETYKNLKGSEFIPETGECNSCTA